jgi:uncharacterized membrane protein
MNRIIRNSIPVLVILLLFSIPVIAGAASGPDYTITYTVAIQEDGSALWHVEYRTLLASNEDSGAFENYAGNLTAVHLPQFRELMQRSAAQAAAATSRHMEVSGFSGDTAIQISPTGRYGVIFYSFSWAGFARSGNDLSIGDVFASGMYLAKDNTLIIRYPDGYAVKSAEPAPDQVRDGLVWYGLRSFGAGEPRLILERQAFPIIPVSIGLAAATVAIILAVFLLVRKRRAVPDKPDEQDEPEEPAAPLSESERTSVEERIIRLLHANSGEMFQSEIVKNLGLPKSTVSIALNDLHRHGIIQKVKKSKGNLIRLA